MLRTRKQIKTYLDNCIKLWRKRKNEGDEKAIFYIDTFQSVRASIFNELLEIENKKEDILDE